MKKALSVLLLWAVMIPVAAQDPFYDPGVVHEIRIRFSEPGWRQILDSLFMIVGDQGKLIGDVTIDGHLCKRAGIRYKGYSSYNANEIKNPFNIDLDYTIRGQNHLGHQKLKLSNVIHDPSFVREVLAYEIARKYMPASEAGYAMVYVNDSLIGLYTNVEAVDEHFIEKRWGSAGNTFVKGEPDKLQYPFGQNANLALTHGSDSTGYQPYYKMESVYGWTDLYQLIAKLDAGAGSASGILDIDRALWMHAFNEVILNLDSYIGYSQNYYLYREDGGLFSPILWDLNMSFGSFRDSDGSRNFQGITIPKLKRLDPLALMDFAISPRPLMTRLFADDTLQKIYFAHMRTILDDNIRNGWYYARAAALQATIDASVLADTNRFYTYEQFHRNLDTTVGGTGGMIEYPGLRDLMEARMDYLDKLTGFSGAPVITDVTHDPAVPARDEPCWITARIEGSDMAMAAYRAGLAGVFAKVPMADDGEHHDGTAGDGIFGAMILSGGSQVQFYIYAQNDSAGALSPPRAGFECYSFHTRIEPGAIVINELHSGNGSENWVELLNPGNEALLTNGMTLSGNQELPGQWPLPDTLIPARGYLVINSTMIQEGGSSLPYPALVSSEGGRLGLYNAGGGLVDTVSYGFQTSGKSTGRYPNGYGPMNAMYPTRNGYNGVGTTPAYSFLAWPNPATGRVNLEFRNTPGPVTVRICNAMGQTVYEIRPVYSSLAGQSVVQPVDVSGFGSGVFLVSITRGGETATKKLIIF